jgi:iron complex outermembrane receptor protein
MPNKRAKIFSFNIFGVTASAFLLLPQTVFSQTDSVDLKEVTISAYLEKKDLLTLPSTASVLDSALMKNQHGFSLVPALNTIPGVRMEERSPGSYRLSIRGSLLRSPFGVRNVKVYLDEFPLTNGGGETYLNLLDPNVVSSVEILRGPDGSLFGANSGGVVRINPFNSTDSTFAMVGLGGGSYGLVQENIKLQSKRNNRIFSFDQGWQKSDGYRQNSAMDRKYFQIANRVKYGSDNEFKVLFYYSDLKYQTPGGLTADQFNAGPSQARPATKTIPGAIEQNASVRNRTFSGGIVNRLQLASGFSHVIAVFGSQTNFRNPFITNYEIRDESNVGLRTWIQANNDDDENINYTFNLGLESQGMVSSISNYGNNKGVRDTVQAIDNIESSQQVIFTRLMLKVMTRLTIETSLSCNLNRFSFTRQQPEKGGTYSRNFTPDFMPRLAASLLITRGLVLRGIMSRGYSVPTMQEIRASDNSLNMSLGPESGWNYEAGLRAQLFKGRFWVDAAAYSFLLEHAIVRNVNASGQEYFLNSGGTSQQGVELSATLHVLRAGGYRFLKIFDINTAFTNQNYKFRINNAGKEVTGVPGTIQVTSVKLGFPGSIYLFGQYNEVSKIPLNDQNSAYAPGYQLVQAKIGWTKSFLRVTMDVNVGIDNALDEKYSLGNDLNAVGARYYNAAAPRNYFAKATFCF